MTNANQLWESGEASFAETHDSFLQVASDISGLRRAVERHRSQAGDDVAFENLAEALGGLEIAAATVISGLEAPDSGQSRAEAVDAWLLAVTTFDSLVLGLAATTTTSSTTKAPTTTATSLVSTPTSTSILTAADEGPPTDDNGGWIFLLATVGVLAYWLGRRRGCSA